MFGVENMSEDVYKNEFKPWYDEFKEQGKTFSLKTEMQKYCKADVEVLSKSILSFRKMFKDKFDIDPFRYITLASLCMSIYRSEFLPDQSIVSNEQNEQVSIVSKEWFFTFK